MYPSPREALLWALRKTRDDFIVLVENEGKYEYQTSHELREVYGNDVCVKRPSAEDVIKEERVQYRLSSLPELQERLDKLEPLPAGEALRAEEETADWYLLAEFALAQQDERYLNYVNNLTVFTTHEPNEDFYEISYKLFNDDTYEEVSCRDSVALIVNQWLEQGVATITRPGDGKIMRHRGEDIIRGYDDYVRLWKNEEYS